MQLTIDFPQITHIFSHAQNQGRDYLFEYEVYKILSLSGNETSPITQLFTRDAPPTEEDLAKFPGENIVLKIVSPTIMHKTEARGVRIVPRVAEKVRSSVRRMFYEVPENYAALIERRPEYAPPAYAGLYGQDLEDAILSDLRGIMLTQFIHVDSTAFGNELIVGLRHTREFGTIFSAGLGGTDAELYAMRFRKGQAIVAASVEMVDEEAFFNLFRKTISYSKLAGHTRGQKRIISDEQLMECFASFIALGRYFSPENPHAPFVIDELEINPFAFTDFNMVPLDGLCKFSLPKDQKPARPIHKIHNLLHPKSIGIMGVSAKRQNFGRTMLDNVLATGFPKENITLFHEKERDIEGIPCLTSLQELKNPLDLLVMAVGAEQVPDLVNTCIEQKSAESVLLIAGGMGETEGSTERAEAVESAISDGHLQEDGGPVFLGANSLGAISRPGCYDTWFVPRIKFPHVPSRKVHRAALISQSGAFMLHRLSQRPELSPAYMLSMGNQSDLTLGDMMDYFSEHDAVDVIAVYAEGFNDYDGLYFVRSVRKAVAAGKVVVFYKAGRTPEGKCATSGHTASMAGDYMVCDSCVREAGAIVTRTFTEFQNVLLLAEHLHDKDVNGRRLAACSAAGFEVVGMADSIQSDEYSMNLGAFCPKTQGRIKEALQEFKLENLVTIQNPIDLTPVANDALHARIADILLTDKNIDALIISFGPMGPSIHSLDYGIDEFDLHAPHGMVALMQEVANKHNKPLIGIVDGGPIFDPYRKRLMQTGIPIFSICDEAIAAISLYIEARLTRKRLICMEQIGTSF